MSNSPFANLPMFGFDIIHADPPWGFDNWSAWGNQVDKFEGASS